MKYLRLKVYELFTLDDNIRETRPILGNLLYTGLLQIFFPIE